MIKSRRMRWARHIARMWRAYRILVGKLEEKKIRTGMVWLMMMTIEDSCEYGNELSGSIKCSKILE
jgi:hypothetical protein